MGTGRLDFYIASLCSAAVNGNPIHPKGKFLFQSLKAEVAAAPNGRALSETGCHVDFATNRFFAV